MLNPSWPGPRLSQSLHLATPDAHIEAPEAWRYEVGDVANPVVVAVIDQGNEPTHPEPAAQV